MLRQLRGAETKIVDASGQGFDDADAARIADDPKQKPEARARAQEIMKNIEVRNGIVDSGGSDKVMTMADVKATAASSGRTEQQVIDAAKARGYTIQ